MITGALGSVMILASRDTSPAGLTRVNRLGCISLVLLRGMRVGTMVEQRSFQPKLSGAGAFLMNSRTRVKGLR